MFQAIQTKFIPCTNFRQSRVKAWAEAGSVTLSWDHGLNVEENHRAAADALLAKLDWAHLGTLAGGTLPSGGYAFTFKRPVPHDTYRTRELAKAEIYNGTVGLKIEGNFRNITITESEFREIKAILGAN